MIQIPAILTGFATKVDGGASVRFSTNELADTDILELKRNQGQFGYLLFKPNEFNKDDIPQDEPQEGKTKSQEFRYWIGRLHKATETKTEKEVYYRAVMDKFIEQVKSEVKAREL